MVPSFQSLRAEIMVVVVSCDFPDRFQRKSETPLKLALSYGKPPSKPVPNQSRRIYGLWLINCVTFIIPKWIQDFVALFLSYFFFFRVSSSIRSIRRQSEARTTMATKLLLSMVTFRDWRSERSWTRSGSCTCRFTHSVLNVIYIIIYIMYYMYKVIWYDIIYHMNMI